MTWMGFDTGRARGGFTVGPDRVQPSVSNLACRHPKLQSCRSDPRSFCSRARTGLFRCGGPAYQSFVGL